LLNLKLISLYLTGVNGISGTVRRRGVDWSGSRDCGGWADDRRGSWIVGQGHSRSRWVKETSWRYTGSLLVEGWSYLIRRHLLLYCSAACCCCWWWWWVTSIYFTELSWKSE